MYKVKFIQHIHGCFAGVSSLDEWLEKTTSLPFPPYKGLRVILSEEMTISLTSDETEIYFDVKTGTFKVYVEADKQLYHADLKAMGNPKGVRDPHTPTIEQIVAEYIEAGWEKEGKD